MPRSGRKQTAKSVKGQKEAPMSFDFQVELKKSESATEEDDNRREKKVSEMPRSGRKQTAKSVKGQEEAPMPFDFKVELKKSESASEEEDNRGGETGISDKKGKKRPASMTGFGPTEDDMGGEVQSMLERFGADISKALLAKRKRLEMYTKASLKTSNQKIDNVLKIQQEQRQKLSTEFSQQFLALFQQWELEVQKADQREDKITNMFRQQQKAFRQARIVQGQRLKTIKQLYGQFLKNMEELEKNHENLLTGAQSELRKEMAIIQKKIMMDTQQQEMASVRKSLQSMLF